MPFLRNKKKTFIELTGKSLPEALIPGSTNPQYYRRWFIDLSVQYMKTRSSEYVVYTNCFFVFVLAFRTICTQHCSFHVLNW